MIEIKGSDRIARLYKNTVTNYSVKIHDKATGAIVDQYSTGGVMAQHNAIARAKVSVDWVAP